MLAQLRGVFAAVQSTEMSEEHQHDRPIAPEISEPMWRSAAVDERRLGQRSEIHAAELRRRSVNRNVTVPDGNSLTTTPTDCSKR